MTTPKKTADKVAEEHAKAAETSQDAEVKDAEATAKQNEAAVKDAAERDPFALPSVAAPEDTQLFGKAAAQHTDEPSDEAEAIAFMQRYGSVPAGWTFDPLTGIRKAD